MQNHTEPYGILKAMEEHRMFKIELYHLHKGQTAYLCDHQYGANITQPMHVAKLTELCDEYFEVDLTSGDLLLLAEAFKQIAAKLKPLEQEELSNGTSRIEGNA